MNTSEQNKQHRMDKRRIITDANYPAKLGLQNNADQGALIFASNLALPLPQALPEKKVK